MLLLLLGLSSPPLFFALTSVFSRRTTAVSSEDKRSLDLDRNQRGGQTLGPGEREEELKEVFL